MEVPLIIKGTLLPYTIDESGNIRKNSDGRIMIQIHNKSIGNLYRRQKVHYQGKYYRDYVHRLVAEHFIGYPIHKMMVVNHKDGNTYNNHVSNLEWVTRSENYQHYKDILKPMNRERKDWNHRKKYEDELNVKVTKGNDIHHIDWNFLNDDIDNLIEVTKDEHKWLHKHENKCLMTLTRDQMRELLNSTFQ
jgi:hypothetical protein